MPAGRPSKYDPEKMPRQAAKLCELGATDYELAQFFEVAEYTIRRWRNEHPEFCASIKNAKSVADERVARSLYHRAVGYTFESEKIFQSGGEVIRAPITEHVPPDATSMIFWLKNRDPDRWRDKREVEHSGKDGYGS